MLLGREGSADEGSQALQHLVAVSFALPMGVARHDHIAALGQAPTSRSTNSAFLPIGEGIAPLQMKTQLHPRLHLVDVLAARPARAREAERQVPPGNQQVGTDFEVGHRATIAQGTACRAAGSAARPARGILRHTLRLMEHMAPSILRVALPWGALATALPAALCGCNTLLETPKPPLAHGWVVEPDAVPLAHLEVGIDLYAPIGNIHVEPGIPAELRKQLTISAPSQPKAKRIAELCKTETTRDKSGRTRLVFRPPEHAIHDCVADDTTLRIPSDLELRLRTGDGLIDTSRYTAVNAILETRNGTIRSGPVTQALEFRSMTGSVEVLKPCKSIKGTTTTGNLIIRAMQPGATLYFGSKAGDCTLFLAKGAGAEIRYKTIRGKFESTLPASATNRATKHDPGALMTEQVITVTGAGDAPIARIFVLTEDGVLTLRRAPRE